MVRRGLPPGHAALRSSALAPAVVLFAILVAHSLLETARDALFLARLGPQRLALAYLVMAACALAAIAITRRWLHVRDPRRAIVGFLVLATAGTAVLAATIAAHGVFVFALYVWTGFIATLVVPSFWAALDRSLQIAEAKRVFAAIGAGGVLGAMTGSAIAGVLGRFVPATQLVFVGALAFAAATAAAIALLPRTVAPEPPARPTRLELRSRTAQRYLRLLVGVAVVATIALTLGDLTFKAVMADRVPADDLATWFGTIYTVLNAIGLAIQLIVTPRLLARWGIGAALGILPVIVLASALGFAITGALVAVIALKLGDGGLRHSLHRVGSEILYLPVPAAVRDGGKLVADALGQRGGQALAAIVAGGIVLLGGSMRELAAVTAVFAALWLGAAVVARRAYVGQLRESLQAGEIQRDVALPPLDAASTQLLHNSLASEDELEALAALDVLARRAHVPASALRDPREQVVRHALTLLGGELPPDITGVLASLVEHPLADVRAAALAASAGERPRLVAALTDEAASVRAVALVHLAADPDFRDLAYEGIGSLLAGDTSDRIALADAIAFAPSRELRGVLRDLLDRGEPPVTRSVLRVFARAPELADLERLLLLLADASVRAEARRVYFAAGARALDVLVAALNDPTTPIPVRRHLPRTLMRFGSPRASIALATRLPHEPDTATELKILRALGRMRAEGPSAAIDLPAVREYLRRSVREASRYRQLADDLDRVVEPGSQTTALICELLVDKHALALERAFRALGILQPRRGWRSAHDAIASGDPSRVPSGRELVDAMAPADVRPALLAIIDGLVAAPGYHSHEALVAALLADPSESLRCAVARHIAEQHLVGARDALSRLRPIAGPPLVVRAFAQALETLDA